MYYKLRSVLPIFLCLLLTWSCEPNRSENATQVEGFTTQQLQQQQESWDRIMETHDAIMPQVGDMNRVARNIKDEMASAQYNEQRQKDMQEAIDQLEAAEEAMFAWMNNLQQPKVLQKSKTHDEIMVYFKSLDQEINQIKDDMSESLRQGMLLLDTASSSALE